MILISRIIVSKMQCFMLELHESQLSSILTFLALNSAVSFTGFGGNKPGLRKFHAYFGSGIMVMMIVHALMGLKLGLSF